MSKLLIRTFLVILPVIFSTTLLLQAIGVQIPSQQVAYISGDLRNGRVELIDINRGVVVTLLRVNQRATHLAWSADGQVLAIVLPPNSNRSVESTIVTINLETGESQSVPIDVFARGMQWSGDSLSQIDYVLNGQVLQLDVQTGESERMYPIRELTIDQDIVDMRRHPTAEQMIVNTRTWRFDLMYLVDMNSLSIDWLLTRDLIGQVHWTADQETIVFMTDDRVNDIPLGVYQVRLDDIEAGIRRLTPEYLSTPFFSLSPDGSQIVMSAFVDSGRATVLYRMGLNGDNLQQVTPIGTYRQPVWRPN